MPIMPMDRNKNNNESETACQNPWEGLVLQATKGIEDVFFVQKNAQCEYENNRTDVSVSGVTLQRTKIDEDNEIEIIDVESLRPSISTHPSFINADARSSTNSIYGDEMLTPSSSISIEPYESHLFDFDDDIRKEDYLLELGVQSPVPVPVLSQPTNSNSDLRLSEINNFDDYHGQTPSSSKSFDDCYDDAAFSSNISYYLGGYCKKMPTNAKFLRPQFAVRSLPFDRVVSENPGRLITSPCILTGQDTSSGDADVDKIKSMRLLPFCIPKMWRCKVNVEIFDHVGAKRAHSLNKMEEFLESSRLPTNNNRPEKKEKLELYEKDDMDPDYIDDSFISEIDSNSEACCSSSKQRSPPLIRAESFYEILPQNCRELSRLRMNAYAICYFCMKEIGEKRVGYHTLKIHNIYTRDSKDVSELFQKMKCDDPKRFEKIGFWCDKCNLEYPSAIDFIYHIDTAHSNERETKYRLNNLL